MEEYIPGNTKNLQDYFIPTIGDVPPIDTYIIEDREPLGPFGGKGVGEAALVRPRRRFSTPFAMRPAHGSQSARNPGAGEGRVAWA
jgi:aldehyde oxidoreductase